MAPTKAARCLPGNWCPSPFIAAWRQDSRQASKPKPRMQCAPMQKREKQDLASKLPPLAKPIISTFGLDQRTRAHESGGVAIVTPLAIRATGHWSHVAAKPQTAVRSMPPTAVRHTKAQSRSVKVDQAAPTTAHEGASSRQHTPDCCESHEAELRQPQPAKEPATGSALPAAVHRNKQTDATWQQARQTDRRPTQLRHTTPAQAHKGQSRSKQ